MPKNHESITIKTGVPGTRASYRADRPGWVRIVVRRNKHLFLEGIDRCSYVNGEQTWSDPKHPGNPGTRLLGEIYSLQPGVEELRFYGTQGVLIQTSLTGQEKVDAISHLAKMLVARAKVFGKPTNP